RDLCGHGVGFELHEDPYVLNYVLPNTSGQPIELVAGMVLAIEPMATLGGYQVRVDDDGWTVRTVDGSVSAQFEHTIAIHEHGHEILTI
ncbi:MAG TPA: M24 family metallopeptidase, partial [Patescibacteria group bacterium]|nr:M24 family metallopeptidase [Patescibacteria group bacterium]